MIDQINSGKEKRLDLELFLSAHPENELVLLRNIIEKLIAEKRREKEKEISVPVSIFSQELNSGEALIKYLKENKKLRFCEISKELNKKENAVWLNYKRAVNKKKSGFEIKSSEKLFIPLYVFKIPLLSYLESIVVYLRKNLKFSNQEIAKLLNKSPQVVSIAFNRAKSKLKNE